eukprot:TRINITY_DN30720_c0_g1_i1.p1 TRINITY_DN30720_c0_g1~~TRINITY_DN30720_c0_g1_i1.p1  ORF type:complete len:415 (+),score=109.91 TRINITY_DN30720_c0_g1_i1:65-1309(+)
MARVDEVVPLLAQAAGGPIELEPNLGFIQQKGAAPRQLTEQDVLLEHTWELGRDRLTIRGMALIVEQCTALQLTTQRTWKASKSVPLTQLRCLSAVQVQTVFYNQKAYKFVCLVAAMLSALVLCMVMAASLDWWITGSSYIKRRGGLTSVCFMIFISAVILIGSVKAYRSAGIDDGQLRALVAETDFMRTWSGPWLPRCIVVVMHLVSFALSTWAGVWNSRSPPYGVSPWTSLVASAAGAWFLKHPRSMIATTPKKAMCYFAMALVVASCLLGFLTAFTGLDVDHCETYESNGFFCRNEGMSCQQTKKDFCDGPVRGFATAQWIVLVCGLFGLIPLTVFVDEVSWSTESEEHSLLDPPMLVTLEGDEKFGYPVACHLRESQVASLNAYLADRHFNAQYRGAALAGFGSLAVPAH